MISSLHHELGNRLPAILNEFKSLKEIFTTTKDILPNITTLSMGVSGDYTIAIEEGSTMVRIGSSIFGNRNYA